MKKKSHTVCPRKKKAYIFVSRYAEADASCLFCVLEQTAIRNHFHSEHADMLCLVPVLFHQILRCHEPLSMEPTFCMPLGTALQAGKRLAKPGRSSGTKRGRIALAALVLGSGRFTSPASSNLPFAMQMVIRSHQFQWINHARHSLWDRFNAHYACCTRMYIYIYIIIYIIYTYK